MSDIYSKSSPPRVALMQPTFLPWLGYFGLIHDADLFVFLDDFQFVRHSFHHRNKIFLNKNESGFVTMPVKRDSGLETPINEAQITLDRNFSKKFLAGIKQNYGFSEHLNMVMDFLENWLNKDHKNLASLNMECIETVNGWLGFDTKFELSSGTPSEGQRSWRVQDLLQKLEAKTYLSARGAFDYMAEDKLFPVPECEVLFQQFTPAPYKQTKAQDFHSHLSVLDAILQIGPEETANNIRQSAGLYKSWDEMIEEKS